MSNIDFKNRRWVVYGAAGWPAYITPFAAVPAQRFLGVYGVPNEVVALWQGKTFDWLFDEAQLTQLAERVLPGLLERGWQPYDEWVEVAGRFDALHDELMRSDLAALSGGAFRDMLSRYYEAFASQYVANNFIEPLSFYFQGRLKALLIQRGVSAGDIPKLIAKFGSPSKPNYLKQCADEYRAARGSRDIQKVLEKYHYINNDYTGPRPVSQEDLERLALKEVSIASEATPAVPVPPKAKALLDVLQMTATIQDVRKAQSLMWISGAERLVQEFARRQRLDPKSSPEVSYIHVHMSNIRANSMSPANFSANRSK